MKKLIALILLLAMLPIVAMADLPDITSMSDQELKDLISAASAELMARNKTEPEGILIFEYEGVRVYQTDDAFISGGFLRVPVAIYNDMEHGVIVSPNSTVCNGWDIWSDGCNASANAKKKDTLTFSVDDADVESIDQINSLRFKWNVTNTDNYKFIYKQEEAEEHRFW